MSNEGIVYFKSTLKYFSITKFVFLSPIEEINFLKSNDIIIGYSDNTMQLISYNINKKKIKLKQEINEFFKFKEVDYRELLSYNNTEINIWAKENKKESIYFKKEKPINIGEIINDVYDSEKKYIAISNTSIYFISKKNIHEKIEVENTLYTIKKNSSNSS